MVRDMGVPVRKGHPILITWDSSNPEKIVLDLFTDGPKTDV